MAKAGDLYVDVGAKTDKLKTGLKKAKREVSSFQKQIMKIGGLLAGAFAVSSVIRFSKEVSDLAGKAEGVRQAFYRLNQPDLLDDLKKATRGTVSEMELMRQAVRAKNFKVPLNQLATFFEFATKRAVQTGESVDYLVNSIIDGIGRKSTLVMDNLGISASELQKEIKKTGDFGIAAGNLIQKGLEQMGDVILTSKQKTEKFNATLENLKVEVGTLVNAIKMTFLPVMQDLVEDMIVMAQIITTKQIPAWQKFMALFLKSKGIIKINAAEFQKYVREQYKALKAAAELSLETEKSTGAIGQLGEKISSLENNIKNAAESALPLLNTQLDDLKKKLEALQDLRITAPEFKLDLGIDDEWIPELEKINFGNITDDIAEGLKPITDMQVAVMNLRVGFRGLADDMLMMGAMSGGIKDFANAVVGSSKRVIAAFLGETVAGALKSVFATMPFPLNIALAPMVGGAAAALFNSLIPSFAEGGFVSKPTLAVVGDAPGGEFITPKSQMRQSMTIRFDQDSFRFRNKDIYLANRSYEAQLNNYA